MINLDQIKSDWNNILIKNEELEQRNRELTRLLANERIKSHQQKLSKNFRIGYIGLAFPFLAFILHQIIDASLILCILYSLFGLIIGAYDIWFLNFVKNTDYLSISTIEAISHASKIVKYQNRATILGLIASIGILSLLFYEMHEAGDSSVMYGGIAGLIIGAIIGIKMCVENHLTARRMLKEVRQLDYDEK